MADLWRAILIESVGWEIKKNLACIHFFHIWEFLSRSVGQKKLLQELWFIAILMHHRIDQESKYLMCPACTMQMMCGYFILFFIFFGFLRIMKITFRQIILKMIWLLTLCLDRWTTCVNQGVPEISGFLVGRQNKKMGSQFFFYRGVLVCIGRSAMLKINWPWPNVLGKYGENRESQHYYKYIHSAYIVFVPNLTRPCLKKNNTAQD